MPSSSACPIRATAVCAANLAAFVEAESLALLSSVRRFRSELRSAAAEAVSAWWAWVYPQRRRCSARTP